MKEEKNMQTKYLNITCKINSYQKYPFWEYKIGTVIKRVANVSEAYFGELPLAF
jgi:hypothetical protein